MKYRVELKSTFDGDENGRAPILESINYAINEYCRNHKGYITKHDSLYDYRYDTIQSDYNTIDERGICGIATGSRIEDDKIFVTMEIGDNVEVPEKCICFYRAKMSSSTIGGVLDTIQILAIDLIEIRPSDNIPDENLSIITTE